MLWPMKGGFSNRRRTEAPFPGFPLKLFKTGSEIVIMKNKIRQDVRHVDAAV